MKILLLLVGVAALTSCSTAYKTGQTPDDVYFSPAKERPAYVNVEEQQDRYYSNDDNGLYNYNYNNYRNDRFLRLSIGNRMRWSNYNDFYFYDNMYSSYDYSLNSPWNSYYYWNNFYNPYTRYSYYHPGYSYPIVIGSRQPVAPGRPRAFNPNIYNNNLYMDRNLNSANARQNTGVKGYRGNSNPNNYRYNNSNYSTNSTRSSTDNNTYNRRSNNNNSYTPPPSRSSDTPVRSYNPSSSSSSGSGSSGGGVSRPGRGGR